MRIRGRKEELVVVLFGWLFLIVLAGDAVGGVDLSHPVSDANREGTPPDQLSPTRLPTRFVFGAAAASGAQLNVTGHVTLSNGKGGEPATLMIHDATRDYTIDLNKVSKEQGERLIQFVNTRKVATFKIPESAAKVNPAAMGIRADCSEMPLGYEDLKRIAERPDVDDQMKFIQALPPATLQTFELLTKSESAQKFGIDPKKPGILRASADGKLIIRYTCDKKSPVYNTVEVIRFDDASNKFIFSEIDFGGRSASGKSPAVPASKPSNRVHEGGGKCMTCHNAKPSPPAPLDPRPNWNNYDQWPGVFGSNQDRFHVNSPKGKAEYQQFQDFKRQSLEAEKDPCYTSLPWPKNPTQKFKDYPYSTTEASEAARDRQADYHMRPGLKFTEIQSRLNSKRIARRLQEHPEYESIRYLIAMDSLACQPKAILDAKIKAAVPGYVAPNPASQSFRETPPKARTPDEQELYEAEKRRSKPFDPRTDSSGGSRLFSLGTSMGMQPMDWTLTYNRPQDPYYDSAIGGPNGLGHDVQVPWVVQAELFRSLSNETGNADLKPFTNTYRGESDFFGREFGCIDDINGMLDTTADERKKACEILVAKQVTLEATARNPVIVNPLAPEAAEAIRTGEGALRPGAENCRQPGPEGLGRANQDLVGVVAGVVGHAGGNIKLDPRSITRGREMVARHCASCHATGSINLFKDEARTIEAFKESPGLFGEARERINSSSEQNRMPPSGSEALNALDRAAAVTYLQSLAPRTVP